jgi:hypothetical protein
VRARTFVAAAFGSGHIGKKLMVAKADGLRQQSARLALDVNGHGCLLGECFSV